MQADTLVLSESQDDSLPLPPKRVIPKINRTGQSKKPRHDDLTLAITNVLAPPEPAWGEDIIYRHSDIEDSDLDLEPSTPPRRTTPTPIPHGQIRDLTLRGVNRVPLDPGIIRYQNIDRSSKERSVLRFDPNTPRPTYASPPTFGHLPGLYIGKKWHSRIGASWDGTHTASVAGIAGRVGSGVWSIALSGGYEDDFDEGFRFVYTGSGGRDLKVPFPPCIPPL